MVTVACPGLTGMFYDLAVGRLAGDLPVRLLALDDRGFAAALSQGKCCGFCCEYGFCAGNLETGSFCSCVTAFSSDHDGSSTGIYVITVGNCVICAGNQFFSGRSYGDLRLFFCTAVGKG